jgi:hypothetical protein
MAVVNDCEFKSPISTATEFLNLYQDRTNTSICSGTVLKNSGTLMNNWATFNVVITPHLIFMDQGTLLTEQHS